MTPSNQSHSHKPESSDDAALKKTVILGVGNLLLSDEGVGVHVANKLMKMDLPSHVQVVEGGTGGFRLMDVVAGAGRLIVVDAVKRGGPPGSIYRFNIKDAPTHQDAYRTSVHQIGILAMIRLSEHVGEAPETTIIGVEPKSMDVGMDLTPDVQARVPEIIAMILEEIGHPAKDHA